MTTTPTIEEAEAVRLGLVLPPLIAGGIEQAIVPAALNLIAKRRPNKGKDKQDVEAI